jgi:hypothetical protein
MSSRKCSNCGLVSFAESGACRRCGGQFNAGYRTPTDGAGSPSQQSAGPQRLSARALPRSNGRANTWPSGQDLQGGIWRDGNELVFHESAQLPDRCLKCNAPAAGLRLKKKLKWVDPKWQLLGLVPYLLIANLYGKHVRVSIGYCQLHLERRRTWMKASAVACVLGVLLLLAAMGEQSSRLALAELAGVAIMLTIFGVSSNVARAYIRLKKIQDNCVWLGSVDEDYLSEFPAL